MSVRDHLDDTFQCAPLKAGVAAGALRQVRQGPRSGGTAFALLHQLVGASPGAIRRAGTWPALGPVAALEAAARRHGAAIRVGAPVARILVGDDAVAGVALATGEEIAAPLVLSSADPARTLLELVDPAWLDADFLHAVRHIAYRGATAVVLFALDGLPALPGLDAPGEALKGTIGLTGDLDELERAFDAAKYGRVSERPHVELTVPTSTASGLAPEGRHVLVARLRCAPYRPRDGAWSDAEREALAVRATALIGDVAPGFADRVLHRAVLAPPDIEAEYALTEGADSHGEPTLDRMLFMRPLPGWARHAMPVDGLYLCGSGAHPGPGAIGGAGWLAAREAMRGRR